MKEHLLLDTMYKAHKKRCTMPVQKNTRRRILYCWTARNIDATNRTQHPNGTAMQLDDANWVPFYETPGSGYASAATTIDETTISKKTAID